MMDETDVLAALRRREPEALAMVFEQHSNQIYRLAMSLLHDDQQADGVVQNTFLALIEHIDRFEGRARLGTWLYRVAYHECIGRLRKAKPHVNVDDMEEGDFMPACLVDWESLPEQTIASQEAMTAMESAINNLPPTLRAVFTLRDVEELSTRETADILGISEAAVKVRLHRARLALRERLSTYFEEYTQL
ncbi:MAG: RNA polymerase sigma factor [Anaerolineae bacterium]